MLYHMKGFSHLRLKKKTLPIIRKLPLMPLINSYFPLIVAVVMLIVPIYMFKRYREYEA